MTDIWVDNIYWQNKKKRIQSSVKIFNLTTFNEVASKFGKLLEKMHTTTVKVVIITYSNIYLKKK